MSSVSDLHVLDFESGMNFIRLKLPVFLNNRCRKVKVNYEREKNYSFPKFSIFCEFLENSADLLCSDVNVQEYYIEKLNKPKNEESVKATTLSTDHNTQYKHINRL